MPRNELRLTSPVGGEPAIFRWPLQPFEGRDGFYEIEEIVRFVCLDIPELNIPCKRILQEVSRNDCDSVSAFCDKFSRAVMEIQKMWKGTTCSRGYLERRYPSSALLKHILSQCYHRAVEQPDKLNSSYEPFSPEVYGETTFELVERMIATVDERLPEKCVFVDLGSGIGQVVLQIAASSKKLHKAWGVERSDLPFKYSASMDSWFKFWMKWYGKKWGDFEIVKDDFLSPRWAEIIQEADLVFANNFAFGPQTNHELKQRFQNMKEGARIISSLSFCPAKFVISDRSLDDIAAILRVDELTMPPSIPSVSWTGKDVTFFIHTVDRTNLERYFERKKRKEAREEYLLNGDGNGVIADADFTDSNSSCSGGSLHNNGNNNHIALQAPAGNGLSSHFNNGNIHSPSVPLPLTGYSVPGSSKNSTFRKPNRRGSSTSLSTTESTLSPFSATSSGSIPSKDAPPRPRTNGMLKRGNGLRGRPPSLAGKGGRIPPNITAVKSNSTSESVSQSGFPFESPSSIKRRKLLQSPSILGIEKLHMSCLQSLGQTPRKVPTNNSAAPSSTSSSSTLGLLSRVDSLVANFRSQLLGCVHAMSSSQDRPSGELTDRLTRARQRRDRLKDMIEATEKEKDEFIKDIFEALMRQNDALAELRRFGNLVLPQSIGGPGSSSAPPMAVVPLRQNPQSLHPAQAEAFAHACGFSGATNGFMPFAFASYPTQMAPGPTMPMGLPPVGTNNSLDFTTNLPNSNGPQHYTTATQASAAYPPSLRPSVPPLSSALAPASSLPPGPNNGSSPSTLSQAVMMPEVMQFLQLLSFGLPGGGGGAFSTVPPIGTAVTITKDSPNNKIASDPSLKGVGSQAEESLQEALAVAMADKQQRRRRNRETGSIVGVSSAKKAMSANIDGNSNACPSTVNPSTMLSPMSTTSPTTSTLLSPSTNNCNNNNQNGNSHDNLKSNGSGGKELATVALPSTPPPAAICPQTTPTATAIPIYLMKWPGTVAQISSADAKTPSPPQDSPSSGTDQPEDISTSLTTTKVFEVPKEISATAAATTELS